MGDGVSRGERRVERDCERRIEGVAWARAEGDHGTAIRRGCAETESVE
jgi:hypothetical protein